MGIFSRKEVISEPVQNSLTYNFNELESTIERISSLLDAVHSDGTVVCPHAFRDYPNLDDYIAHGSFFARTLEELINTHRWTTRSTGLYEPYSTKLDDLCKEFRLLNERFNSLTYSGQVEGVDNSLTLEQLLEKGLTNDNLMSISFVKFISAIEELPHQAVKSAYANIMYTFFTDTRNNLFISSKLKESIADDLHNLPLYLGADLEGFRHEYFWSSVFDYKFKKVYILKAFLQSIKRYNQYSKKQEV